MRKKKQSAFENDFFVAIPDEYFNEIEERKMTPMMWCVYSMILRQASFDTGIWKGCAYKVHDGWGGTIHVRTVQDKIKQLEEAGYLKPFRKKRGQRGNYPVAIHRYPVRFGPWKGYRLNANKTNDPDNPVYERDSADTAQGRCSEGAQTAKEQSDDCATPASPIASVPYIPDSPEVPKEKERENVAFLSSEKQHSQCETFASSVEYENAKESAASRYFVWLARNWPELSLTRNQKNAVRGILDKHGFDLDTWQSASKAILGCLDVSDTWAHAGDKLVANLYEKAEACRQDRAHERHTREMIAKISEKLQRDAEAEAQRVEAEEKAGKELWEELLGTSNGEPSTVSVQPGAETT